MSATTVDAKPACRQRDATLRTLGKTGLSHTKSEATQNADAREYIMSLGYLAMPVAHPSPTQQWSGFRLYRLPGIAAG